VLHFSAAGSSPRKLCVRLVKEKSKCDLIVEGDSENGADEDVGVSMA